MGFSCDCTRSTAHDTRYHRHAWTLDRPAQAAYYNKVYKSVGVRPAMDPCQTVQHIADHASGGGHFGTLHPEEQSSGRGAAGGAELLAATAASLFGLSPDS